MDVLIFGAGSLGSLVGGLLARAHDVTLVGREPHVSAVREDGLAVTGQREFRVEPAARTDVPASADLAVVTVKAYDTPTAAARLSGCSLGAAVSLQNGMGNEEVLSSNLGCRVLAGTCTYGARLTGPSVVECTGVGEVVVGLPDGGYDEGVRWVGEVLNDGLDATVSGEMPRRLWEKLAVNAGVNPVTALARVDNGALAEGPASDLARDAAAETARVAREVGVDIATTDAVTAVEEVVETTAANASSMRQDVEAGRRTEVDAINGYVTDRGDAPTPVNETLTKVVRSWERARDLR